MYFKHKSYDVIVNGSVFRGGDRSDHAVSSKGEIRLVTVHDEYRPSKRIHDVVEFVRWARERKDMPFSLTIVGYTGRLAACTPVHIKKIIETAPFITTFPGFKSLDEVRSAFFDSHIYITFTYRDSCPNTVIEAMAHGLPVIGIASGGVPDIVGDAGILLPLDDFADGFFSPHRYECDFPSIDFEEVLRAVLTISGNLQDFRTKVRRRFETELEIGIVAGRYLSAIRSLLHDSPKRTLIRD